MATYYADSSVLAKRHVPEHGSAWVQTLMSPDNGHLVVCSRVSTVEVISALMRRQREGSLRADDYGRIVTDFEALYTQEYQLVELTETVADEARRMLERHPLRTYDAVQLASALLTNVVVRATGEQPLTFLAADDRLLDAAQSEGFAVDNPNWHP